MVTAPFDLEHTLFLCDDKNHLRKCIMEIFFAISNGYASDDVHPRELLMYTGRKPG